MVNGHERQILTVAAATAATAGALLWFLRRPRKPQSFSLEKALRPSVLRVKAYAFPPRFDFEGSVLLDGNENPYGPPIDDPSLKRLALERYPDPRQPELKAAIAHLRGVGPDELVLGVGSDEVIDLIIRIFCSPGVDSIVVCPPTYAMYSVFAAINDVGVVTVPLTPAPDFQLRPAAIAAVLSRRTKVIFLTSPGNPTARLLALDDIEAVLKAAGGAVVVVDEAYIDFAPGSLLGKEASAISLFRSGKYPNLVVMQTLSKAWGLAGARLGLACMSTQMAEICGRIKAPFNISSLTEDVVLRALARPDLVAERVATIMSELERVSAALKAMQPKISDVYPSEANFVLFRAKGAYSLCQALANEHRIVVRYRGSMKYCEECVRLTIGTKAENDKLLDALRRALV